MNIKNNSLSPETSRNIPQVVQCVQQSGGGNGNRKAMSWDIFQSFLLWRSMPKGETV